MKNRGAWYRKGLRDGLPVGLGYLAVSFSFGIQAIQAGITWPQAVMMSLLNLTSAGQFGALSIISASGSYISLMLSQAIINLRYCLMSSSLSQRLDEKTPLRHRLLMAYGNTDEVFALSAAARAPLSPYYTYGLMSMAIPGWTVGTLLGAIAGSILPNRVLSALGVALYAMFCAIIFPPAKTDKVLRAVIVIAMLSSLIVSVTPLLREIPSGLRVMGLTLLIAGAAALIAPVKEERS
ncbi:MAG: AzlC family ABC transporter permease [Clostridiales bacterium]|nr:AzlC family ABC transporter permease [Clostridiales bacterium]